jgi:parallel beta-helix repeat protein
MARTVSVNLPTKGAEANRRFGLTNNESILGVREATLFSVTSAGDTSALTQTTDFVNSGDWITQRADSARVLLTNSSGSSVVLKTCVIRGKPVTMLAGEEGRIHDEFQDTDDIERYGDKTFEFGNEDVIAQDQLNKLADYWWKYHKVAKHIYVMTLTGMWHFLQPGEWATLQVGGAGEAEYIDSTVEVFNVRMVRRPGELGETVVILREIEEAWKNDSNAAARFVASGGTSRVYNNKLTVNVASQYHSGSANVYCDGTNDEEEINSLITLMADSGIGGTVHLTAGTYNLGAQISMKSGIILEGEGNQTIIEKNFNGNAIRCDGGSGTEITNVILRDFKIQRNASDTNTTEFVYFDYVDEFKIERVTFYDVYRDHAIKIENCDAGLVSGCRFEKTLGVTAITSTDITIRESEFLTLADGATDPFRIFIDDCTGCVVSNNHIHDITSNANNSFMIDLFDGDSNAASGNTIEGITSSSSISGAIHISGYGDNGVISNNVIASVDVGDVIYLNDARSSVISGNSISAADAAISVIQLKDAEYSSVTGNTIFNFDVVSGYAIFIDCDYVSVTGNTMRELDATNTVYGVYSQGDYSTISSNNISDVDSGTGNAYGVYVGNGTRVGFSITSNTIRDVGSTSGTAYGVFVHTGVTQSTVVGNNITLIDDFGIYIEGDDNGASNNTITQCDTGIEVHTSGDRNVLTGNRVTGNTTDNLDDNGTNTTDSGNDWN